MKNIQREKFTISEQLFSNVNVNSKNVFFEHAKKSMFNFLTKIFFVSFLPRPPRNKTLLNLFLCLFIFMVDLTTGTDGAEGRKFRTWDESPFCKEHRYTSGSQTVLLFFVHLLFFRLLSAQILNLMGSYTRHQ